MSRTLGAVLVTFTIVACLGMAVAGAGKPAGDVPVTLMFTDAAGGWPLEVGSDGGGPYSSSTQNVSSEVRSYKTGSDLMLFTYTQTRRGFVASSRGVRFDLSDQDTFVQGFDTPIAANTVWPAHLKVHCSGVNVDMLAMALGGVVTCPGSLRFWQTETRRWYRLSFNDDNYTGVDRLKVTCTEAMAPPATGCKSWTVTPMGTTLRGDDPNPKNYTRLLEVDEGGFVVAEGGTYYVGFAITVMR